MQFDHTIISLYFVNLNNIRLNQLKDYRFFPHGRILEELNKFLPELIQYENISNPSVQ